MPPFKAARLSLFDEYQSLLPRKPKSQPVVIVEVDEATLGALGQWPWPRNYFAALIDAIAAHKPSAVGLDIIMPEPDHASPQAVAESRPDLPEDVLKSLAKAASNDSLLANSLANAPAVLGSAGFSVRTSVTLDGLRTRAIPVHGSDPLPWLNVYPYVLASLPEFQAAAKGQALLSSSPERGVVRRAAVLTAINGSVTPGLSLEMLRVAHGVPNIIADVGPHGISAAEIGSMRIPLQSNGEAWVHFDKASRHRYISALSVLKNEVPEDRIAGKMVLVGLTGLGLQDMITTPFGDQRPGVEVHAQLIESFEDGVFLTRPWWISQFELGILIVGGLLMIWKLPKVKSKVSVRRQSDNRALQVKPNSQTAMAGGSAAVPQPFQERRKRARPGGRIRPRVIGSLVIFFVLILFGSGLVLFRWSGLLFDSITLFIGLTTILGSLFFSAAIEYEQQRKEADEALQNQRLKAAQMTGELNAARRIQLGTLPDASTAFPGETRFEIEAMLEPARQVGGDLYDFFMIDEKRLFFIIGDVAGKGLPASLFMVVTKALAKSAALRGSDNIGTIISKANVEMARENPEMLFVTGIAGILDVESGMLELVNAGHDAPWHISAMGITERITGGGGPPLGVMDEFDYPFKTIQLDVGDTLLFLTDGVSEAMNAKDDLYGTDRITALLKRSGTHHSPKDLASALREDVRVFVGDTEPSDDITLMVVHWLGSGDVVLKHRK